MAINFPNAPTLNQIFNSGNTSFIWSGSQWVGYSTSLIVNYNASSIIIQDNDSIVGATTSINFGDNLDVSFGSGISTITVTGASQFVTTAAGIHTLSNVGIGTTNPTSKLTVSGDVLVSDKIVAGLTSSIIPFYWENFSDLPSFSAYHGAFAHVHQTGKAYYAHTRWVELVHTQASGVVGTGTENYNVGIVTATAFSGLGSGLTNLPASQLVGTLPAIDGSALIGVVGSGSGVIIQGNGTPVGTAGTINFGTNLSVSFGSGIATVSASSSGSSQFVTTSVGIHTLSNVGIGTTNPTSKLTVSGNGTFTGVVTATTFVGALTGTATSTTNIPNLTGDITSTGTATAIASGVIVNADINASAGIVDTKLDTISTALKVSNSATTATSANTNSAIVARDGSGNFSAGIITATSFYGDASYTASGRWTVSNNSNDDYTFTGIGFTQTTNDPVLYLARGRVYEFVNNSVGSHPFQIRVSNGGSAYSNGVTNNSAASGVIRFEIPFNAPNTLYYQCTSHSGMGNTISVYPST